jgi:hypothetical protein
MTPNQTGMQQAKLARWAVKTSLLLALKKSRREAYGWVPSGSMHWLYENPRSDQPPPGVEPLVLAAR